MRYFLALGAVLVSVTALHAALPDEMLPDPALEARARSISKELRCVVCQNQSIDDSSAPLARDLRLIVREQLVAGKSDQDVKAYLVKRYGTFVLLKPPINTATLALWFGPLLLALLGGWSVSRYFLSRKPQTATPAADLSADEQERARKLLDQL